MDASGKIAIQIEDVKYNFNVRDVIFWIWTERSTISNNSDIAYGQPWYIKGFTEVDFLSNEEFIILKNEITQSIQTIVEGVLKRSLVDFTLEDYHKFIIKNDDHLAVVSQTRDLFEENVTINLPFIIRKIEDILHLNLTDIVPSTNYKMHLIIRINRPNSNDFNPPHKDIYEFYDEYKLTPKMINCWIPVAGVDINSSLPIAPASHLISENKIERTFTGGYFEGNKYRVRIIKKWDGSNKLLRSKVNYGQILLFSPYLVHGVAINNTTQTRVALELRLFEETR
ncbi:MAG: phytanoyl-CoA dioxygenase family protein [Crocinitomicaceae bacterium]